MALLLQAASRESLADLSARLDVFVDQVGAADLERLGNELFAVTELLAGQKALRRQLADPSVPGSARTGLAEQLLGSRIQRPTLEAVTAAVAARWSRSIDLVDGLELLARNALLGSAEKTGRLDEVEDELFRFGRILDREPRLAGLLADTDAPADGRTALLDQVLGGKVAGVSATLLRQAVRLPRGRHLDDVAEELAELAAARRQRSIARVTTPVALTDAQEDRLRDSLSRLYGRPISVQIELDEALLGGLVVRVGGDVIDGSVAGRLEAARRQLPR
jgi:F-type H+-transporting ATPase subunit delta